MTPKRRFKGARRFIVALFSLRLMFSESTADIPPPCPPPSRHQVAEKIQVADCRDGGGFGRGLTLNHGSGWDDPILRHNNDSIAGGVVFGFHIFSIWEMTNHHTRADA